MHRLATVHARDNQPTTNDVTTQPMRIMLLGLFLVPFFFIFFCLFCALYEAGYTSAFYCTLNTQHRIVS